MKERKYLYIGLILAYLISLGIVHASAHRSLKLCIDNPEITEYSMFMKLAVPNR